jgi:hypothetical protein
MSPSQERYARYYGLASPNGYERLVRALKASPDFTLRYRHGQAFAFEVVRAGG